MPSRNACPRAQHGVAHECAATHGSAFEEDRIFHVGAGLDCARGADAYVGADDGLLEWNRNFHTLLDNLAIEHEWGVVPNSPHDLEILMQNWEGDFFGYYRDVFAGPVTSEK